METDASKVTKLSVLVVILAVFTVIGWRLGDPISFNNTLADAGLTQPMPAPAPAQEQPPAAEEQSAAPAAPAQDSAPAQPQPPPAQPQQPQN